MAKLTTIQEALRRGIEFIACNDEPSELCVKEIAGFISTITLSEATGYSTTTIAKRVRAMRVEQARQERGISACCQSGINPDGTCESCGEAAGA